MTLDIHVLYHNIPNNFIFPMQGKLEMFWK